MVALAKGPKFEMGRLVATPGVLAALQTAGESPLPFVARHVRGDWGDVGADDRAANDADVDAGGRLLSAYTLSTGVRIWLLTEADRSVTTVLLPEEY